MPNFSNEPPSDVSSYGLPIIRTPGTGSLVAVVTSPSLIGCDTHYFGGRTVPCERPECEACNAGMPFRWHGYVSAWQAGKRNHCLFEVTAQAAEAFVHYRNAHDTLRGCLFEATRFPRRSNGRVVVVCKPADLERMAIPEPPDLQRVLAILWNLPIPEKDRPDQNHGHGSLPPNMRGRPIPGTLPDPIPDPNGHHNRPAKSPDGV